MKDAAPTADAAPVIEFDADTISRAEILAPGIKQTADLKLAALKAAHQTADGKAVIDSLLGNDAFDSMDINTMFHVASTLLRAERRDRLASASRVTIDKLPGLVPGPMTPEKLNEQNAAYWSRQSAR